MNYLFGDSTPSQLSTNFLEFLRDAIDFSVFVLQADERIKRGQTRSYAATKEAEAETGRLDRFITIAARGIDEAEKGAPDSPTAICGARLLEIVGSQHQSARNGIAQTLAEEVANIEAKEAAARKACFEALETLILSHDPPDASSTTHVALIGDGSRYGANLAGRAEFGLDWTIDFAIPESSLFGSTVTVSRIAPQLEMKAPQLTGWISKEVKVKPQKLERFVVVDLVDDGDTVELKLRPEPGATTGFDLAVDPRSNQVRAARIGPADDASVGPFEPSADDIPALVQLAQKLRAGAAVFSRKKLLAASTGGVEFSAQPEFIDLVERLITMMTPIVRELAERSLSQTELIMRKPLADDRREEIFVAKSTLREKYSVLSPPLRALFVPLGLDDFERDAGVANLPPMPTPPQQRAPRAELPASEPPPPMPLATPEAPAAAEREDAAPPISQRPPPLPPSVSPPTPMPPLPSAVTLPASALTSSVSPPTPLPSNPPGPISSTPFIPRSKSVAPRYNPLPPARPPPRRTPPPGAIPTDGVVGPPLPPASGSSAAPPPPPSKNSVPPPLPPISVPPPLPRAEAPNIEVEMEGLDDLSLPDDDSDRPTASPPEVNGRSDAPPPSNPFGSQPPPERGAVLVAALKKIIAMSRGGEIDEAYRAYAELFAGDEFGTYHPEEQRQALRLMVVAKAKPPPSEAVLEAHRAALTRILTLTETLNEATDYETLGVAYVALDDIDSARSAFTTALAIERDRNPGSELVGTLMRRVSEI